MVKRGKSYIQKTLDFNAVAQRHIAVYQSLMKGNDIKMPQRLSIIWQIIGILMVALLWGSVDAPLYMTTR